MGVSLIEYDDIVAVRGFPGVLSTRGNGQAMAQDFANIIAGLVKVLAFPMAVAGIVAGVKTFVSRGVLILKARPMVSICLLTILTGKVAKRAVSVVFVGEKA